MTRRQGRWGGYPRAAWWLSAALLLGGASAAQAEAAAPPADCGGAVLTAKPVIAAGLVAESLVEVSAWDAWVRVVTLRDYNTRVVVLGTMLLGMAAGVIGCFMLLHKQALLGDALSHATLPGIALAFMIAVALGFSGKSLYLLLLGAAVTGAIGVGCILVINHLTRLKQDTALGIVLSVFFGAGVAALGIVQKMQSGHAAGLESFIYGKTASMLSSDAMLIGAAGLLVAIVCTVLYKELALLCFDRGFARAQGWPAGMLDVVLMTMVTIVTVIGLQAVGLILIVALLIIPPAAARFWTNRLLTMILASAAIGAASAMIGAGASAVLPNLPSGAVIVLSAAGLFLVSMVFAPTRGALPRWIEHFRLGRRISRQHLLRAMYERAELTGAAAEAADSPVSVPVSRDELLGERSWSAHELARTLRTAQRDRLVAPVAADGRYQLTKAGVVEGARLTRNHRLWELYLINYADVAPSHVDRDAEEVEHVLGQEMVERLESLLRRHVDEIKAGRVPLSPHGLATHGMAEPRARSEGTKLEG